VAILRRVARIDTERTVYALRAADGPVLAELADDTVRASGAAAAAPALQWREVEVELKSGNRGLLADIGRLMGAGGARLSTYPSKLSRVLGAASGRHATGASGGSANQKAAGPAAVVGYLSDQHRQLLAGDIALRAGQPAVHDTRVAMRRIRSTLRTFAPLFGPETARRLDDELRWIAAVLGGVRDLEVLRARFTDAVHGLPGELVLGPVAGRIEEDLLARQVAAQCALDDALISERYLQLLAELDYWLAEPVLRPDADQARLRDLADLAGNADRKARRRLRAALRGTEEAALHGARKAAKRARYAHEVLRPYQRKAARRTRQLKTLQNILGEHQDSVVARTQLRRMALSTANRPDQNGFTYGLLYGREEQRAAEAVTAARDWP
jgi:CHAD domain-containing protein